MYFDYPSSWDEWGALPEVNDVTTRFIIESVDQTKTGVYDSEGNEITMTQEKRFGFVHFD